MAKARDFDWSGKKQGFLSTSKKIRDYYDGLKSRQWRGGSRTTRLPIQYSAKSVGQLGSLPVSQWPQSAQYSINRSTPYSGPIGKARHLRATAFLGGLYLLSTFRSSMPKLLTTGMYAVAPILGTTKAGKIARMGMAALRAGQTLGIKPAKMTNTYADITTYDENPLRRITDIVANKKDHKKRLITSKYGLDYDADTSFTSEFTDMVPVHIGSVQVRGVITGLSDTFTGNWAESNYVGRPDPILSYTGFTREVTFDLTFAAVNSMQLRKMYQKLNAVAKYVTPMQDPNYPATRFSGKLATISIGNYIVDEVCAVTSMTITPHEEGAWEIGDPEVQYPSLTLVPNPIRMLFNMAQHAIKKVKAKKRDVEIKAAGENAAEEGLTPIQVPASRRERQLMRKNGLQPFIVPKIVTVNFSLKVVHSNAIGVHGKEVWDTGKSVEDRIAAFRAERKSAKAKK